MLRKSVLFVVIIALLIILAGIGSGTSVVVAQSSNQRVGNLRVVNALVGIGPVDVFLDSERIAYKLQPKDATPYYFIPAGSHQLTVRLVDADPLSIPIADTQIDLAPDNSLTAIAYEKLFTGGSGASISQQAGSIFVMNDDRSPTPLGRARLAVAHLAVGTPQHISIGYRSGEALLYQIGLEQPFGTIDMDSGVQTLAIIDADSPNLSLLANFGDFSFYSNTLYTLIVVPNVSPADQGDALASDSKTPQMFIISAPLQPPESNGLRLRIVHAAHDTAVLDVYVDERLVAGRFNYGRYTDYLALANYGHTITLRRFGDPITAPPLGRAIFTITPDNKDQLNWTLLLVNTTSNAAPTTSDAGTNAPTVINTPGGDVMVTILPDNISATQRNFARVRVINAADGVQSVGLFTPAYPPVILPAGAKPTPTPVPTAGPPTPITLTRPVLFGAEANDAEVPAGLYKELDFVPEGGRTNLDQQVDQALVSGLVYTYIVMGSPAGNPPIQVITIEDYGTGVSLGRQYVGVIQSSVINVRAAASSSSANVGSVHRVDQISVLGRTADARWLRIRAVDAAGVITDGWISATIGIRITRLGAPVTVATLPVYNGP